MKWQNLVNRIGIVKALALLFLMRGRYIHIPKAEEAERFIRNEKIRAHFTQLKDCKKIAALYGISERQIQYIVYGRKLRLK